MRLYDVTYVTKHKGLEEEHELQIEAKNAAEAVKRCRDIVFRETKKHAFRARAILNRD